MLVLSRVWLGYIVTHQGVVVGDHMFQYQVQVVYNTAVYQVPQGCNTVVHL